MVRRLFINDGTRQDGPYDESQIASMVGSGYIVPGTLCWEAGMENWAPVSAIMPHLFKRASAPPPPVQPPGEYIPSGHGFPTSQPEKKRSCCCLGCLILLLLLVLGIGGIVGFAWFKYRTPESPVNREFESVPDYFPPESILSSWTGGRL